MDILEKLFGSTTKVKLVKLFIFNPEMQLTLTEIKRKLKANESDIKRQLALLSKISLIKSRKVREKAHYKRVFAFNPNFSFTHDLREFLMKVTTFTEDAIIRRLQKSGRLRLGVVAGVFLNDPNNPDSRVDILIVGDKFKKNSLEKTLKEVESELGKEISYCLLDTDDFKYRLSIGDKLVRDVFDYPHQVIYNKIGLVE